MNNEQKALDLINAYLEKQNKTRISFTERLSWVLLMI
jgi:hypothetical protein